MRRIRSPLHLGEGQDEGNVDYATVGGSLDQMPAGNVLMRTVIASALSLWTIDCSHPGNAAEIQPLRAGGHLELVISLPFHQVDAGEPVDLNVDVVNNSNRRMSFLQRNPDLAFQLRVLDAKGIQVPLTSYGKFREADRQTLGRTQVPITLNPGQKIRSIVRVNRQFDLSLSGTYRLSASFVSLDPPNSPQTTIGESNSIAFSIAYPQLPEGQLQRK